MSLEHTLVWVHVSTMWSLQSSQTLYFLLWKAFESFYLQQKIASPWASLMNARVDLLGSRLSRARHMSHHWVSAHVAANPASRNLTEWWAETWKQSFQFIHQISRVKMVQNGFSDIIFLCFQGTRFFTAFDTENHVCWLCLWIIQGTIPKNHWKKLVRMELIILKPSNWSTDVLHSPETGGYCFRWTKYSLSCGQKKLILF